MGSVNLPLSQELYEACSVPSELSQPDHIRDLIHKGASITYSPKVVSLIVQCITMLTGYLMCVYVIYRISGRV